MGIQSSYLAVLGMFLSPCWLAAKPYSPPPLVRQPLPTPVVPDPRLFFSDYPSFNSQRLDQQLALYTRYLAVTGIPDVLIIGSSRSLQGVDPIALQAALVSQGYPRLRIYNLGINGATAQVVDLVIRRLLSPEHLPPLIIWADGLRAFNSSRPDATYNSIIASPGYERLLTGDRPIPLLTPLSTSRAATILPGIEDLQATGFRPVPNQFNPATYYRQFPRVPGQYDSDYTPLQLTGTQTDALVAVSRYLRDRQRILVVVNLPIAQAHLDTTRQRRERQFRSHMEQLSIQESFLFRDFMGRWASQSSYFADPSHINQQGARAVAEALAADQTIPWRLFSAPALSPLGEATVPHN